MERSLVLDSERALLALIDVQENHYPTVHRGAATLDCLLRLLGTARLLDVPIVWTEQYPKAFGPTLAPVAALLDGLSPISKLSFGCFGEPRFLEHVEATARDTLVLTGCETHICVLQTGLAALERGMRVVAVADCLTARKLLDHKLALARLQAAGAVVTTWESLVYEWMRHARHPRFKKVLTLVKG